MTQRGSAASSCQVTAVPGWLETSTTPVTFRSAPVTTQRVAPAQLIERGENPGGSWPKLARTASCGPCAAIHMVPSLCFPTRPTPRHAPLPRHVKLTPSRHVPGNSVWRPHVRPPLVVRATKPPAPTTHTFGSVHSTPALDVSSVSSKGRGEAWRHVAPASRETSTNLVGKNSLLKVEDVTCMQKLRPAHATGPGRLVDGAYVAATMKLGPGARGACASGTPPRLASAATSVAPVALAACLVSPPCSMPPLSSRPGGPSSQAR